jgi:hypothetical protein
MLRRGAIVSGERPLMIRPLCRNCGATIHRSFTCVSFGDPPPYSRYRGENPYGKDFPDSIAEVERLTGRIAVDVRWRQDVERWIDWAKLWDGESYRDRHFCGQGCAMMYGYHAAKAGTAPTAKHAEAAEKQRTKLAATAAKARRRLVR